MRGTSTGYNRYGTPAQMQQPVKERSIWTTCLWVLGWLTIFPIPLTILVLRRRNWSPQIRTAIISGAWGLFLIFAAIGGATTPKDPTISQVSDQISQQSDIATAERERAEEEARQQQEEAEAKEKRRQAEEEAQRIAEEEQRKAEEEARRIAEEEQRNAEEEAQRQAEQAAQYEEEENSYQAETYQEPVHEEPAYEEPVYEEPAYEEPVYEAPVSTGDGAHIVFVTPGGGSYHYDRGCRSLARSKEIWEMTQDEAIAQGKADPCDLCAI